MICKVDFQTSSVKLIYLESNDASNVSKSLKVKEYHFAMAKNRWEGMGRDGMGYTIGYVNK